MENLLLWGFYLLTFYAFLPGLVSRTFGFKVFKKGRTEREIALTFDDGPDPVYTPQLLDLLARYDAKATFFVVGAHAELQPELLRRMRDEGHVIGIHNYVHKSNWLMRPSTVKKQIRRTCDIIREATGERASYYRPPWGIVNLFDFSNLGYLKIILWSSLFGDWRIRLGADRLGKRIMKKLNPGEVLLLHDCGQTWGADPDAPANMLKALEACLIEGLRRGYRFVHIEEMIALTERNKPLHTGLGKRLLVGLWMLWESAFHVLFRLKPVSGGADEPAFHYRMTTYGGPPVKLEDGVTLSKGDPIAELHFDNRMLQNVARHSSSPLGVAIHLLRVMEKALPLLASSLLADPKAENIRAVYGITMIHRGASRLGFDVVELPENWFARISRIYLRLLFRILTSNRAPRKKRSAGAGGTKNSMSPRMLLMSRERILRFASPLDFTDEECRRSVQTQELPAGGTVAESASVSSTSTVH
ncbi:polysaccharide deacetylase family protein [Paenibacillus beijingensis]|uniref:polysaccharide deacetylase family protein n=1 Tax=Paenibacillus beijingensis TaxID=1126833 RepID=UPI0006980C99|nr:polysaccharide deacetylase family protein [Paenibacillus beijingensis]